MIGNGEWIFMAVLLITLAALAYGLFTAEGSGIALRPWGSRAKLRTPARGSRSGRSLRARR